MQDAAVFVVIEVVSVKDPEGLRTYIQRADELIVPISTGLERT